MKNELTYHQTLNLMTRLGDLYRCCVRRLDVAEASGRDMRSPSIRDDYEMKVLMERTLADCSRETRLITTRDFLEVSSRDWYRVYFSRSQYYRLRRKAVDEFLRCLDNS